MKKAIKKTCVVLLLFALLASQVAASYSETGTLNEGTSAISAAERYLSNWAYNSYMYADKNLTLPVCAWRERSFAFNPARTFSESSGSMPHHPAHQTIVPILLRLRAA